MWSSVPLIIIGIILIIVFFILGLAKATGWETSGGIMLIGLCALMIGWGTLGDEKKSQQVIDPYKPQ